MRNIDLKDDKLSSLLKNELPEAPYNPWFTRKVLNRLPDRKKRIAANIEIWVCIVAAVITLVFGIRFAVQEYSSDSITLVSLLTFCVYCAIFGSLVANAALPLIKRQIRG